jgi:PAS domain S-box-containing protein
MINRRKDGTIYYEEQTITPVTDSSGEIANFVTIKNDITERRRAAEDLERAKTFSDKLINTANVIILGLDPDGNINIFNQMAETITGYTRDELVGRNWFQTLVPRDRFPEVWQEFGRLTEGGLPSVFENPILTKDGTERRIMWQNSQIFADGKVIQTISFGNDITEHRNAEEALRRSEERYRDLVENALDIIYTHDLDGRYTSINSAVERITGYTIDESLTMQITDSVAPEQIEKAKEMIGAKLAGKEVTAYELEIIAKDGRRVPVEVNTRIIYEKGEPVGVQGIARDITERKHLEEQLRQSQKLESIGRLAGGIAHDFNNMLTAINGYSELTLRQIPDDSPIRSNIEEIKKAGERSAMLTGQLLAFSRRQVLRLEDFKINDVINDTSNLLKRMIGDDVELVTVLKPTAGTIRFDRGQLSQILMNLAVNARDAMPDGGKLTIETSNVFIDPAYTSNHIGILPGAYVMLTVTDSGVGMTPEVQAQIYEPFFTTKGIGKGTGLGLATVYGIIKQSGGGIFVYSEVDRGTTFKIYIPRAVEAGAEVGTEGTEQRLPMGTETILLAEDNDVVRELSRQVLETCGYTVLEAIDGVEALAVLEIRGDEIDLVITDVIMPRIGGRELAEKIGEMRPDMPILFSSGFTDDAVVRHGELDTNTNFIQKPFNVDDVARKVRNLLDSRTR